VRFSLIGVGRLAPLIRTSRWNPNPVGASVFGKRMRSTGAPHGCSVAFRRAGHPVSEPIFCSLIENNTSFIDELFSK